MNHLNELLHNQLNSNDKEQFWCELMNFVEEQLKYYNTHLMQSGLDLSLLKNMQTEESIGKNLRQIRDFLIVLSKWSQNQEVQAKRVNQLEQKLRQKLEVASEIEVKNKELQRQIEDAKNYLEQQKKKINTTKIKSEKELSNKLGIVRNRIQVINEMVHAIDKLEQDNVNNIQSKVSDEIQKIVEVMTDTGVWPEDEEKPLPIVRDYEKNKSNKIAGNTEVVELVKEEVKTANGEVETVYEDLEAANGEVETVNEDVETINEVVKTVNEEFETVSGEVETENEEFETVNEEVIKEFEEITSVQAQIDNNAIEKSDQVLVVEKQPTEEKQFDQEVNKKKALTSKKQSKSTSDLASHPTKDGNNEQIAFFADSEVIDK
jgi:chromosome segregation ATPase